MRLVLQVVCLSLVVSLGLAFPGSGRPYPSILPHVDLVISANTNNYNVFTSAGSPASAITVTLTINAGVLVGSTSTAVAALDTGALPVGSSITIINNGTVEGAGGNGGGGGGQTNTGLSAGGSGGPALVLHCPATITNNGNIWGGGGGGGGGGGCGVGP